MPWARLSSPRWTRARSAIRATRSRSALRFRFGRFVRNICNVPQGFFSYVKAAFSAKPLGMPIAPNWVGIVAFGIAGFLNPGFWLLGAGAELAYLLTIASNKRFQRIVDGAAKSPADARRLEAMISTLPPKDLRQYQFISSRCREILKQQQSQGADISAQAEALSRLVLVYLQLQVTRLTVGQLLEEGDTDLPRRLQGLKDQLVREGISAELRNSLEGQLEILQHRLAGRAEAQQKLDFVTAELVRIQEQVELVREQSMLSGDPATLTSRIDAISGSLAQTGQWVKEQQQILGRLDDLSAEPPPLLEDPQKQ